MRQYRDPTAVAPVAAVQRAAAYEAAAWSVGRAPRLACLAASSKTTQPPGPTRELARRIGNRGMNALVAGSGTAPRRVLAGVNRTIKLGKQDETVEFDDFVTPEEDVRRTWVAIHEVAPQLVAIDSQEVASMMRTHWEKKGAQPQETAQLQPAKWDFEDLKGLQLALDATGALFRPPAPGIPKLTKLPAEYRFGFVSGLIDTQDLKFAGVAAAAAAEGRRGDLAETILPFDKPKAAIGMSAACALEVDEDLNALEPHPGMGDQLRAAQVAWKVRRRRATWVHEIGHTIYPHFRPQWLLLWLNREPARKDSAPTGYAKENKEEDFCESFMLFVLYQGAKLDDQRRQFLKQYPQLPALAGATTPKSASVGPLAPAAAADPKAS